MKRQPIRLFAAAVLVLAALCVWYSIAANYGYEALAGAYGFHADEETCVLHLDADQTFQQEITRSGKTSTSQGHWHRYGQSHVSFSGEFQLLPGEQPNAAGEAHGEFKKVLGIFPTLVLAPTPSGPKFHRLIFHSDK